MNYSEESSLWYIGDNHTSDMLLICKGENGLLKLALVERRNDPFDGKWAFPGGFISGATPPGTAFVPAETPEEAVIRELKEETGVDLVSQSLLPIGVYDDPERDPRARPGQRVVTHAFLIVLSECLPIHGKSDARIAQWFNLKDILNGKPPLAFDHAKILQDAISRYSSRIFQEEYADLSKHPRAVRVMKLPIPLRVCFASSAGTLQTLEGPVSYQPGDAILTGNEGESWPMHHSEFNETYEPLGETTFGSDGLYVKKPIEVCAVQLDHPEDILIEEGRGQLHGEQGDWLVEYSSGKYGIVSGNIFEKTYRILS